MSEGVQKSEDSRHPERVISTMNEEIGVQWTMDTQKKHSHSSVSLESLSKTCLYCGASIDVTGRSSSVVLYTRSGPIDVSQTEKRCKNRDCRVGYWYGYHMHNGLLVYDHDALANEYLMISRNTAFEILYLYEMVMTIFHGNVCFRSVCAIYNSVHYSAVSKDTERYSLYYKGAIRKWAAPIRQAAAKMQVDTCLKRFKIVNAWLHCSSNGEQKIFPFSKC